jgi:hypothetical protein
MRWGYGVETIWEGFSGRVKDYRSGRITPGTTECMFDLQLEGSPGPIEVSEDSGSSS